MAKYAWKILKLLSIIAIIFFSYMLIVLIYGTATDYQPEKSLVLKPIQESNIILQDSVLTFMTWNVGYGGLGAKSNFFFDKGHYYTSGGNMVVSPKEYVEENIAGGAQFLLDDPTDIYLLQEVDIKSNRSHFINQFDVFCKKLNNFEAIFSPNYKVGYVPVPIFEPWNSYGSALSGLATLSRFKSDLSTRFQLPGSFNWPDYIFQLDRCAAVNRYKVANGKELVVFNIHNSAYDKDGVMKKQQMNYLKSMLLEEYALGNFIVAGGDWNQCPPGFAFDTFKETETKNKPEYNIKANFLPPGWQWIFDPNVPTNRRMKTKFDKEKSFVTLIDYFLISPNVEVLEVKGRNLDFEFSDHQPVRLKAKLVFQ